MGRRSKQTLIPGSEPECIQELDDAAEIYYDVMKKRCELSKEEDEAKDALIDKMKENGLTIYETGDGKIVTMVNKSNVKCKRKKDAEDDDGEE